MKYYEASSNDSMSSNKLRELNPLENFVSGGLGGILNVISGHPLDTVKVRLQTSSQYTGTLDCVTQTIKKEGFLGLYKGVQAPLIGIAPIFAVSFFGFGLGKQICQTDKENFQKLRMYGAGAFSGFTTTTLIGPFERVKCLLQVQAGEAEKKYNGAWDATKKLYKEGGIANIYRGVVATGLRDIPAAGMYFLAYDFVTEMFSKPGEPPTLPVAIFGGGMAGICNWIVAMPADTVKSRLQTAPEGKYPGGMKQVFAELVKNEGLGALYKGFTPVILRAFPANAATFVGFELGAKACRHFNP